MKEEKEELFNSLTHGITLIALVITIIVLVILASVAISLSLGNNGIFNRTKYAKEKYLNVADEEKESLAQLANQINGNGTITSTREETIESLTEKYNDLLAKYNKEYMYEHPETWAENTLITLDAENRIYGYRATGTITTTLENQNHWKSLYVSAMYGTQKLINNGGAYAVGGNSENGYDWRAINTYNGGNNQTYSSFGIGKDWCGFNSLTSNIRTNMPYDIWFIFQK